jgi:hypothetical protein
MGYLVRPGAGPFTARAWVGYGFAAERMTGGLELAWRGGAWRAALTGAREVRDFADEPGISGVLNTFLSQELGHDYGDYVLLERVGLEAGTAGGVVARFGYERAGSVATVATPSGGTYGPNPALGSRRWWVGGLSMRARAGGVAGAAVSGMLDVEGGAQTDRQYARARATADVAHPLGPGEVRFRGAAGWASTEVPPHRLFVLGGRGSLVGEPYRAFGGRRMAWARLEYNVALPAPAIPLGRYASTGRQLDLAPYVAVGWASDSGTGLPWAASDGVRPVLGVSARLFHRLLELDLGWAPRSRSVGFTVDVRRDLWPLL